MILRGVLAAMMLGRRFRSDGDGLARAGTIPSRTLVMRHGDPPLKE